MHGSLRGRYKDFGGSSLGVGYCVMDSKFVVFLGHGHCIVSFLYDYTVHLVSPDRQITRYIVILIFCNLHFGYNVIYYIESERSGGPVGDSLKRVPTEVSAFPHSHVKQRRNRRCRMLERALVQKEALTIKRKSSIWKRPRAGGKWATARDGFTSQEKVFHAKESDRTIIYEY